MKTVLTIIDRTIDALWTLTKIGLMFALMLATTASIILLIAVAPMLNELRPDYLRQNITQPLQKSSLLETELEVVSQPIIDHGPVFVYYEPDQVIAWTDPSEYRFAFAFENMKSLKLEATFYVGRQLSIHELDMLANDVFDGSALKWRGVGPISGTTRERGFEIDHDGFVSWISPGTTIDLPVEPLPFNTEIVVKTINEDGEVTWQRFILICENGNMSTIEPTPAWEGPGR